MSAGARVASANVIARAGNCQTGTTMVEFCNDHGQGKPGCLGVADPTYTMDYTDVEPGAYIHWCSVCGREAREMESAIQRAFRTRPGFEREFREAIERAEGKQNDE